MKLRIGALGMVLLVLVSLIVTGGCAPKEMTPPQIKISGVYPLQLGSGSVDYEVVFSIYNPNSFMVVLDTLEWNISTKYKTILDEERTAVLARRLLLDDVYIPANTEVKVTSAFAVALSTVIGEVYMELGADALKYLPESMQKLIKEGQMPPDQASGMVSVGAIACMFPLWKLIGASRPPINPNLDTYLELAVWEPAASGPPLWTVEGTASFLSEAGTVEVPFELQWQQAG